MNVGITSTTEVDRRWRAEVKYHPRVILRSSFTADDRRRFKRHTVGPTTVVHFTNDPPRWESPRW